MVRSVLKLCSNLLVCAFLFTASVTAYAEQARELTWENLVPQGWDPNSVFNQYSDDQLTEMTEDQFNILQEQAQALLDAAPTVDKLDGEQIKIPGFILPLEFDGTKIKEFLLVPYYGACVHTPPPPANQVIHAKLEEEFTMTEIFEPVWISGKLNIKQSQATLGESGISQSLQVDTSYTMDVEQVEPYTELN